MSFSGEIKEELSTQMSAGHHCRLAETAAILHLCGKIQINEKSQYCVKISTETLPVARKYFTLLKKAFNIKADVSIRRRKGAYYYSVVVRKDHEAKRLLRDICLLDAYGNIDDSMKILYDRLLKKSCCKRAFIRGAFLAVGSASDPQKSYHLEYVCVSEDKAIQLRDLLIEHRIDAKIVSRKNHFVVYVKEGSQIVELLGLMGAHVSLMQLENVRIVKEISNSVNRKVNCETANLNKTVSAAVHQIEDIQYIENRMGLGKLNASLQEIARIRLEYPDASLKELGDLLNPPVGKSGVNHRLRKLSMIAEQMREGKEEHYD